MVKEMRESTIRSCGTAIGEVAVAASGGAIVAVAIGADGRDRLEARFGRGGGAGESVLAGEALRQIKEYLGGRRRDFGLSLRLRGTRFRKRVWGEIARIPYGENRSYGEIARRIGSPGSARAVGAACRANPVPLLVPCHRVVAAGGRLGGYSSGVETKRFLLRLEEKGG